MTGANLLAIIACGKNTHMLAHACTHGASDGSKHKPRDKHRAYASSTMISDLPGSQHSAK